MNSTAWCDFGWKYLAYPLDISLDIKRVQCLHLQALLEVVYQAGYYYHSLIVLEEEVRFREIHLVLWGRTVIMGFKAMGLGFFFCFPFFDLQWKFQKYMVMTDLIFNTTACQKSRFLTLSQLALTTSPMWWTLSGPLTWEAWEDHSHQANLKEVGTSLQTPFGLCAYQHSVVVKNLFMSVVLTVIM